MKSLLSDNSIMDVIVNATIPDKDGNDRHLPDGFRLPELEDEKLARFADGAIDGIFIYHTEHQTISDEARELLVKAMKAVGKGDREEAKKRFEELGTKARAISAIDDLQQYIIDHKESVSAENVVKFALYTLYNTADRESLKFALSMLELVRLDDDSLKDILRVVGLSDEFTLEDHRGQEAYASFSGSSAPISWMRSESPVSSVRPPVCTSIPAASLRASRWKTSTLFWTSASRQALCGSLTISMISRPLSQRPSRLYMTGNTVIMQGKELLCFPENPFSLRKMQGIVQRLFCSAIRPHSSRSISKAENFRAGGFHFRSKIRRLQSRCAAGKC